MTAHSIVMALIGGSIIGVAAGAFLIFNGRIAGISGVLGGLLVPTRGDVQWRLSFVAGLVAGGVGLSFLYPSAFPEVANIPNALLVAGGLLVGFGTRLGSGCTSGHGVCGLARLSPRSLVATMTFMATGVVTVAITTKVFGG